MLLDILIFIVSLFALIKASDFFTDAAEKIGIGFGIHPFIIGVTIVALGTSLPELISSIIAVHLGSSEIVVGNVLGSNITNIFLILGVSAIVGREIQLQYAIADVDLPLMVGSAFLMGLFIWDGDFSLMESILSLLGLIIYLTFAAQGGKSPDHRGKIPLPKLFGRVWIQLIISGGFIYLGARYTVVSIIHLSDTLQIGKEVIAASAVALGTSLPELAVSIAAVRKKKGEIAIGNILGSNIFNTFAVMGIPSLCGPLIIPRPMVTAIFPIMLIATLMYHVITHEKRITLWEGALLLLFYLFFLVQLF